MDEHRLGLKPILRRVWARRGQRIRVVVRPRYEWEYVYGFVQPAQGTTHSVRLPTVSTAAFSAALANCAQDQGVGPTKQIVLALDGAGWHSGTALQVPAGLHLVPLPPYSPELQPAERLWPLVNEPLANRTFDTLEAPPGQRAARQPYLRHPRSPRCGGWRAVRLLGRAPRARLRAHRFPLVAPDLHHTRRDHPKVI
jgi:transposase